MKDFLCESVLVENSMLRNDKSIVFSPLRVMMISILLLFVMNTSAAWAASLQELRASGALGENSSGYVVARDSGAKADAATINKQRKALYAEKAKAQGVSIDQVGKVYASEILKKVPKGTWIQNEKGQWLQK